MRRLQAMKRLLDILRSAERKISWTEGYITSHIPDAVLIQSLEQNSQSLKNLETQLLKLIDSEEENERSLYPNEESDE